MPVRLISTVGLIKREVIGKDVPDAFVHLEKARTNTGAVPTVDGDDDAMNVTAMIKNKKWIMPRWLTSEL